MNLTGGAYVAAAALVQERDEDDDVIDASPTTDADATDGVADEVEILDEVEVEGDAIGEPDIDTPPES
jgi:hypothetical protein